MPFSYHDPIPAPSPKQSASTAVSLYLPILLHHISGVVYVVSCDWLLSLSCGFRVQVVGCFNTSFLFMVKYCPTFRICHICLSVY